MAAEKTIVGDVNGDGVVDSLDESLLRTEEVGNAVFQIAQMQEETERRIAREQRLHQKSAEKAKALQQEQARIKEAHEQEISSHQATQTQLQELEQKQAKIVEGYRGQLADLDATRAHNEALRAEMEAERKALKIQVDWAAKHAEMSKRVRAQNEALEAVMPELAAKKAELLALNEASANVEPKLQQLILLKEKAMEDQLRKGKSKGQTMAALEKQLANSDSGLQAVVVQEWRKLVIDVKNKARHKDQGMKSALRAISAQGEALIGTVFTSWKRDIEVTQREKLKAQKNRLSGLTKDGGSTAERARQATLKALEKSLAAQSGQFGRMVFEAWRAVRWARVKSDQGKAACIRGIANSEGALSATCFQGWKTIVDGGKANKEKKEASMQKAMRMVNGSQQALLAMGIASWGKIAKKNKAHLMKMKMVERNLLAAGAGLLEMVVGKWAQEARMNTDRKSKKDANMQHGLRMIANSGNALVASIYTTWAKFAGESTTRKRSKSQSMSRATRMISNSQEALTASSFGGWMAIWKKRAGTNTRLRVLQRIMAQDNAQILVCCLSAWCRSSDAQQKELKAQLVELKKQLDDARTAYTDVQKKEEQADVSIQEKDQLQAKMTAELEQARKKARVIRDELAKVGITLTTTPKKTSRPNSGARAPMTRRSKDDSAMPSTKSNGPSLPRIDAPSPHPSGAMTARPPSGNRSNSTRPDSASRRAPMAWQEDGGRPGSALGTK